MKKAQLKGNGLFNMGGKIEMEKKSPEENKEEIKTESQIVSSESQSESEATYKNISLTINRKKVSDFTIPMTYRLKASTIEKIRYQAKQADMYINEYLQAVLDLVLDSVEIK